MLNNHTVNLHAGDSRAGDLFGFFHHDFRLFDGSYIDQAAIESHRALAGLGGFGHGVDNALGLGHFFLSGAEDRIGELDLARMNGPFALAAQHPGAIGLGAVAVAILEVTERPVDRAQAVGARGDDQARDRVMPDVGQ